MDRTNLLHLTMGMAPSTLKLQKKKFYCLKLRCSMNVPLTIPFSSLVRSHVLLLDLQFAFTFQQNDADYTDFHCMLTQDCWIFFGCNSKNMDGMQKLHFCITGGSLRHAKSSQTCATTGCLLPKFSQHRFGATQRITANASMGANQSS